MLKCIVLDDEPLAIHLLEDHINKVPFLQLAGSFNNPMEALVSLNNDPVDLVFLDIQMPQLNGVQFMQLLQNRAQVIITSAYQEYAIDGFEHNVIDYLLKPISFERFSKTINKIVDGRLFTQAAKEKDNGFADHIFIKSNSKFFKVNFSEIIYVEGMKDYLKVYTAEYKLITHQTMNEMEKILSPKQFIRVHKSYIVAIPYIKSIYGNSIAMEKVTIPIGSSYKDKVVNLIGRKP